MQDILIRRQRKREAEQAIADLKKKGYVVIYPLTQFDRQGKVFERDSFNRSIFVQNTFSSCWVAKMRRPVE